MRLRSLHYPLLDSVGMYKSIKRYLYQKIPTLLTQN